MDLALPPNPTNPIMTIPSRLVSLVRLRTNCLAKPSSAGRVAKKTLIKPCLPVGECASRNPEPKAPQVRSLPGATSGAGDGSGPKAERKKAAI